jgi:hypothetical protein
MTNAKWSLLTLAFVLLSSMPAASRTAWVLPQGKFSLNLSYVFETFDEFWMGRTKAQLPDDIEQHTVAVGLEYGLFDAVTVDLTLGYTRTSFSPADDLDGLNDTTLGVRWRVVDEFAVDSPYIPTLTVRVGGIIAGTYDTVTTGAPHSPGDGASGVEMSLLFGKALGNTGFGLFGEVGYRHRLENVPDDFFASLGVYKTFLEGFIASFGYRRVQGLSGLDIGGPGFTPARFPETQEIFDNLEAGLGYTDTGGRHYGLFGAWTIDGKNAGEKTIVGASLTIPF